MTSLAASAGSNPDFCSFSELLPYPTAGARRSRPRCRSPPQRSSATLASMYATLASTRPLHNLANLARPSPGSRGPLLGPDYYSASYADVAAGSDPAPCFSMAVSAGFGPAGLPSTAEWLSCGVGKESTYAHWFGTVCKRGARPSTGALVAIMAVAVAYTALAPIQFVGLRLGAAEVGFDEPLV